MIFNNVFWLNYILIKILNFNGVHKKSIEAYVIILVRNRKLGYLKKDDIVIGSDEVDKKFLTPCGKVYESYNECVRETNGNVFNCIFILYIIGKE